MAERIKATSSKKGSPQSLGQQVHEQVMDLLDLADKSNNPDIRAAAIEIAKKSNKHFRKQEARVSPNLVLLLNCGATIAVVFGCRHAFVNNSAIAWELSAIYILVFLAFLGTSLTLCGYMSQANLMKILGWLASHARGLIARARGHSEQQDTKTDSSA